MAQLVAEEIGFGQRWNSPSHTPITGGSQFASQISPLLNSNDLLKNLVTRHHSLIDL